MSEYQYVWTDSKEPVPPHISDLLHYVGQYDIVTGAIAKMLQREWANKSMEVLTYMREMDTVKSTLRKLILSTLESYPIWEQWLKKIPGIGPGIGGYIVGKLSYARIPIMVPCPDCKGVAGNKACRKCKGNGEKKSAPPRYEVYERDFPTVSKLWKFSGMHVVNGKAPRPEARKQLDYTPGLRTKLWQFSEQIIYQKSLYRELYDVIRPMIDEKHPDIKSKAHRKRMALRKVLKIFLSHYYVVSRTLAGKEITKSYAHEILGHVDYIEPFYWNGSK